MESPGHKGLQRREWLSLEKVVFAIIVVSFFLILLAGVTPQFFIKGRIETFQAAAKTEMQGIMAAISMYETTYNRFPTSTNMPDTNATDFTFGTFGTSAAKAGVTNASGYQANNSEIMAILMDMTNFPDGRPTPNPNHSRNPSQMTIIQLRMAKDTNSHGLGADGVYRDPWGNPYIITIDLNRDGKCRDAFYRLASVSETNGNAPTGLLGLARPLAGPYATQQERDSFEVRPTVIVWSLGPDGKADLTRKANEGANKDNIVSWQ